MATIEAAAEFQVMGKKEGLFLKKRGEKTFLNSGLRR